MDEKKNTERTVEVVDTSDQPAEGGRMVKETVAEHEATMNPENPNQDELAPLFADNTAENFRTRWLAIQSRFVDDPKASVKEADDLVADVIQGITSSFADRRGTLEKNWNGGGNASTEDLRLALKQYRSFFDRLLSLQS
ncbi:MAG: hypothetical protein ACM3XO_15640 [Bacteroidota bacterium]